MTRCGSPRGLRAPAVAPGTTRLHGPPGPGDDDVPIGDPPDDEPDGGWDDDEDDDEEEDEEDEEDDEDPLRAAVAMLRRSIATVRP